MRFVVGFASALAVVFSWGLYRPAHAGPLASAQPAIEVTPSHLDFKVGKDLVTRYAVGESVAKPYFWPVNALPGKAVTRGWPMEKDVTDEAKDHVHQKSLWFCHGDVIPEGIDFVKHIKGVTGVDFWSENKGHGKIVCVSVGKPESAGNHAWVQTKNEWRTTEGQKILDETRTIHLYHTSPRANLLVLDIVLEASVCPITFGDTKEGSLGVRVRESLRVTPDARIKESKIKLGQGQLTNAEGKSGEGALGNVARNGCWGLVSAWCDSSGPVDPEGTIAGIAVFADPANKVDTAWHARNYGLMAANPFGRKRAGFPDRKDKPELVKLNKGEKLLLRYGVFLHGGDVKEGKVAEHFELFKKLSSK